MWPAASRAAAIARRTRSAPRHASAPARARTSAFRERSDRFPPAEQAALEFAVAAASVPGAVDEAIGRALRAHWDDGEIVEIAGVVALFGFLNRWNDAMATELEAPAAADGERWLAAQGWSRAKHGQS
jgi:alkylhydroperoxidase family enzyme